MAKTRKKGGADGGRDGTRRGGAGGKKSLSVPILDEERIEGIPSPRGKPVSKAVAQEWLRGARDSIEESEHGEGIARHRQGTYLLQLHAHRAWMLWGDYTGFFDMVKQRVGIGKVYAKALMRFAKVATLAQAQEFGRTKTMAGHTLVKRLGLKRFDDLFDGPLLEEKLGHAFDFRTARLADLEELLEEVPAEALPPAPATLHSEAKRQNQVITEVAVKHPALKALGAVAYVHKGRVKVRHGPAATREEYRAAAAMYRKLGAL